MTDRTIIENTGPGKEAEQTILEPIVDPTILESAKTMNLGSNSVASKGLVSGEIIGGCQLDEPLKVTSGEADLWIGTRLSDHRKILAKIYRWGMRPKVDVRENLSKVAVEHVVELLGHGQYEDGRHYELLEYIEHGTLSAWARNGLSEQEIKDILRGLAEAIIALHAVNIVHRDIKPDNVLVRSKKPLNLVLTDFGISSVVDLSLHYTSMNRTAAYASPESLSGTIGKFSDWWSLAVIMMELLDKNPFAGIDERTINFTLCDRGISVPSTLSEEWQLLLRGLLTRDHEKRWGAEQVSNWLKGRRDIPAYYEESQAIAGTKAKRPYKLAGKEYQTPADLGRAVAENWSESVKHLARGMLTDWVKIDVCDQDMANQLADLVEDKNLTGEMKAAIAGMILNSDLPVTWQGEIVNTEWMAKHSEWAVSMLESHTPEWSQRLRGRSRLIEMRQRRNKALTYIKQSGVPCNQKLVDQMIVGSAEMIWSLTMDALSNHLGSSNPAVNALFHKKPLMDEDKILLVACERNLLVTKTQWQEWEKETKAIKEWAQRIGISLVDDLLTKAVRMQGDTLRKAVASLRTQFASSTVEELRNILTNNTLTDREARLLIACSHSLLLTKEQLQKQEWEKDTREIKEMAQKFGIRIDDNLLAQSVRMQGDTLRNAIGSLRTQYASASVEELRNFLANSNLTDHEARLLIACDHSLLVTRTQIAKLKESESSRGVTGGVIGAAIGAITGASIGWQSGTFILALIYLIVGAVLGILIGGYLGWEIAKRVGKRAPLSAAPVAGLIGLCSGICGIIGMSIGGIVGFFIGAGIGFFIGTKLKV